MLAAALFAAALLPASCHAAPPGAPDSGQALYDAGSFEAAAADFRARIRANPSDPEPRVKLGACLLKLSDPAGADDAFSEALTLKARLAPRIARIWKAEGQAALRDKEPAKAAAHFTKAVSLDRTLAQPLGVELIKAADALADETERARLVTRATPWAGTSYAALRTANWYTRRFGPPRRLKLDEPGWVELAGGLLPGDILYYVSSEKLQQRDAGSVRILPQALDIPVKLTLTGRDVGERGDTSIWVGRADQPVEAWFWLLPGGRERPRR